MREEIILERGLKVDHSTICRWVHTYSPEIDQRTRRFLKPTNDSWRVDETYIKVRNAPPLANWTRRFSGFEIQSLPARAFRV